MDWQAVIVAVTPLVIAAMKWIAPKVPSRIIPVLAPAIGAAVSILGHYTGIWTGDATAGALLGMAGVGLREMYDQLMKPNITATTTITG